MCRGSRREHFSIFLFVCLRHVIELKAIEKFQHEKHQKKNNEKADEEERANKADEKKFEQKNFIIAKYCQGGRTW